MHLNDRVRALQSAGAVRLVGFNGTPAALPDAEILGLREVLGCGNKAEPFPYKSIGKPFRILRGPFAGLEGKLLRHRNRWRVVLSIELIQRSVLVDMDAADLNYTKDRMIASVQKWVESKQQELLPANSLRARFTTAAFWSIAGAVVSRGCVLLASIACARLLGKTGFGELGMIQSTVGVFGIFAGLGLGLTATKFVSEFRDSDPERVGQILGLSSVTAAVSGRGDDAGARRRGALPREAHAARSGACDAPRGERRPCFFRRAQRRANGRSHRARSVPENIRDQFMGRPGDFFLRAGRHAALRSARGGGQLLRLRSRLTGC